MYFGEKSDNFFPPSFVKEIRQGIRPAVSWEVIPTLNAQHKVFLHQNHSTLGHVITSEYQAAEMQQRLFQGDYLITDQTFVALGVLTADCLPIIIYDPDHHVVANVHAGWKGSVAGVVEHVVDKLVDTYKSDPCSLEVYFGPSAGRCCYLVQQDVIDQIPKKYMRDNVFDTIERGFFFDTIALNKLQLLSKGVQAHNMTTTFALCTMCDPRWNSHRRDGDLAGRQITIVALAR